LKIRNDLNTSTFKRWWTIFWMRFAGLNTLGRVATRLATWYAPPHKAGYTLAGMNPQGFIAPSAVIYHSDLRLGKNVFVGDRVLIYQAKDGGSVELGDRVYIYRDTILETGYGGSLSIGSRSGIHPRCQFNAYVGSIHIGRGVDIAPNCAFYPYDHGLAPDRPIREQPLETKGDIVVEDHAWLGVGVIVLSGVRIGKGSVIGAGSVVTGDIPDGAIAVGSPARVVKMRSDVVSNTKIKRN
jgi:acetyltransferase-like isoleucine patch superfamily enzyme